MHVLFAVVAAAAAAATAFARPPAGMKIQRAPEPVVDPIQVRARPPLPSTFGEYMLPRYILPHFLGLQEDARLPPPPPPNSPVHFDWLSREIDRLNMMDFEENSENFDPDPPDRRIDPDVVNFYEIPPNMFIPILPDNAVHLPINPHGQQIDLDVQSPEDTIQKDPKEFALTPKDDGYFEVIEEIPAYNEVRTQVLVVPTSVPKAEIEGADTIFEEPRKTRQNPTLSKTKTLIADNLDRLRTGMLTKDFRVPVSLLPSNLRWLSKTRDRLDERHEGNDVGTVTPSHIHLSESAQDPTDSIYGVALIAAVGAALTVTLIGFGFGWYTLSKKAKAAADVDYPAYGVTGPSIDMSADRKLAHSAHMYHYQHQKQQILAMERSGMEHRNGSASDNDSEEENEEGDYTVYEYPGFATTGDMEVKNPMFSDDPTPATPGKCEVVKPQPKK